MSRERALVELTEMLHQNFLTGIPDSRVINLSWFVLDVQKLRSDMLTHFKEELDNTRQVMQENYDQSLQNELARLEVEHEQQLREIKKKQWCFQCGMCPSITLLF